MFRSFTKFTQNGVPVAGTTIGVIEQAMHVLKPKNSIDVRTISRCVFCWKCNEPFLLISIILKYKFGIIYRTDAGVHALNAAVVVDLQRINGRPYDCDYITTMLNESFEKSSHQIRINQTEIVPNSFNARINAVKSRTYLYRFGIIKPNLLINTKIEEKFRCYFKYS